MDTSWTGLGTELQKLAVRCSQFGAEPDPSWKSLTFDELVERLQQTEEKEGKECDDLILELLSGKKVQPTPLQLHLCAMRCLCALDTLGILHTETDGDPLYPNSPKWPWRKLNHWLLVDNWHHRRDTWLKLTAAAVATGRGFYSG